MERRLDAENLPYEEYSNRQLAAVPLAVLAVGLLVLVAAYLLTGTPVALGMEFTGGTEVRFGADAPDAEVRDALADVESESIRSVGTGNTYVLATQIQEPTEVDEIETAIEDAGYEVEQTETRSPTFGADTQNEALLGVVLAFVGMSVLVALMFRTLVPSAAVVASAFSDLVIPLALMSVLGIELTLGAIAALLMLIGYSVDSDILLNNHVLKRHGGFYESASRAMRTGVSMTVTSIVAMVVMFVVATLFAIPLLPEIALILVFGLAADLMNTYMLNMSLLRWYKFEGIAR